MSALAYFITFHTYGSWLHGREAGSVDRQHNHFGAAFLPADKQLEQRRRENMSQPLYLLDARCRDIVLESIRRHAEFRGWVLHAVHVRTNHVHLVVSCSKTPEQAMNEFKAYASRALNDAGCDEATRKRWSRHGSTRHLFDEEALQAAIRYTVEGQGAVMSVYARPLPGGRGSEISHRSDNPSRDHYQSRDRQGAANQGAANQGAANQGAANQGAANQGAANQGAANP